MTYEPLKNSATIDAAEVAKMFGPPPILSTESIEFYDEMLTRFLRCLGPDDFIVLVFIRDLANFEWEVQRLTRHKTWAIERKFRQRLEYQKSAERKSNPQLTKPSGQPATGLERVCELEVVFEATIKDVDEIFKRAATEIRHAQGLEEAIGYYERLDTLLNIAIGRRNSCLDQIKRYRADLHERVLDEIIELTRNPEPEFPTKDKVS